MDSGGARSLGADTGRNVVLPDAAGSVGAVELRSVVGARVDDFATAGLPRADRALVAIVLISVTTRIFVAGVLGSAGSVDHLTDVGLVALFLDEGAALVTDGFSAPQAAILVLASCGISEVGAVVTAAARRVEVDGIPGAVVDGVVEAGVFGPVEARANHAEVAGVDDATRVGTAGTQVGAVQAELFEANWRIGGGDPVTEGGAVDGAKSLGIVDGALVVAAAVQTDVPGALGIGVASWLGEVLGFAGLVLAEFVGGVVDTFLRGGSACSGAALECTRVGNAGTLRSGVEGVLGAGENTEGVNDAVGASISGADLGTIESKAVEVGAATVVGAGSDRLGVPVAASTLVASVGLIDLRAVFGSDSELGTNEGSGVADTIENLVVDVGEVSVSVVLVGGRGDEAHQPLLVLEVFAGDLSLLVEEDLSSEDVDAGILEGLSGAASVIGVGALAVSEDESDLFAERALGGGEDVLGLVDGRSDNGGVSGRWANILLNVVVDIHEEFSGVTGESSLGTVRAVGDDGGGAGVEFDETNTHAIGVGGSGAGLGASEGGGPDPLLEEGVQGEPTVVGAANLVVDAAGDTVDDDEIERSAADLETAQAADGGVDPEAARVSGALAGSGEVLAGFVDASGVGVVGLGFPHALRTVATGAGVRTIVRTVGDAAHGRRDGVVPAAGTVGAFAGEFIGPLGALAFRADIRAPFAESVTVAGVGVVVGARAFTALELLRGTADRPCDGAAVVEAAGSLRCVNAKLFATSLRLGEPLAVVLGVGRAGGFGSVEAVTLAAGRRVEGEIPLAETGGKGLAVVEVGDGARVLNTLGGFSSTTVPLAGLSGSVLLDHAVVDVGETSALVEAALLGLIVPGAGGIIVALLLVSVRADVTVAEVIGG